VRSEWAVEDLRTKPKDGGGGGGGVERTVRRQQRKAERDREAGYTG
jgi:hypothetical protein